MTLLLTLFALLPQNYVNLLLARDFNGAVKYCEEMITKDKSPTWRIELGDAYLYGLEDFAKAADVYAGILKDYKQKDGSVYYRYGLTLEHNEDFLNAAKQYEIVATRYRKAPLDSFALTGVERCFKKNYQDIVATINGYNITRLELDDRLATPSAYATKDEKAILDNIILERLLYINGLKYGAREVEYFKLTIPTTQRNLLLEELRANLVVIKAKPTEKQLRAYFNKNRQFYKLQEEIHGKEIVVESESLVKFLLDSLTKDEASFDTLAKLYSTAPTRNAGGNMGIVYKGTKPKEIEPALFAAKVNVLTGPLPQENKKFGIYLVTQHLPEHLRAYKDCRTQLESSVNAENVRTLDDKLLKDLRAQARIEVFKDSIAVNESLLTPTRVIGQINGLAITWADADRRNIEQPSFAKVDMGKPDDVVKIFNIMADDLLKLNVALRNKYFLYEGYYTQLKERERQLMEQTLYNKIVLDAVKIDSTAIAAFYQQHKEEYKVFESVDCQELVVKDRKLAENFRKQVLIDPTQFDTLIRINSIATSKLRYGKTGPLRRGAKSKVFEDIVYKLKPDEFSRVFAYDDTSWGFVKLLKYTPTTYRTFAEVKPYIETTLRNEQRGNLANSFLAKIRAEANIKILLPEVPPEGQPAPGPEGEKKEGEPTNPHPVIEPKK